MKNILTLLLLLNVQQLFAEKLIFTNNNEQVDITGNADINYQTGDISVTTVGEHQIINVNTQPVILGFYPSDYDIAIGSTITVNWNVAFAESCTASVPSGNATWTGNKQSSNGSWSQNNVTVTQLPSTLRLECLNAGSISTVETFTLTEQTGDSTSPEINSFTINSQSPSVTVNPPGSATVAWSTTGVSNCTASASPNVSGWSGNKNVNGSQTVTISQNTTMTLSCNGIVRNVNVIFSENSSCTSSVYPPNLSRLNGVYADFNDGFNFGESTSASFLLDVGNGQFASLSGFSLPRSEERRRMVLVDAPTDRNKIRVATISISECPGDFTQTALCVFPNVFNGLNLRITTRAADNSNATQCKVDPSKTYYINYVTSPAPYTQAPDCDTPTDTTCSFFYNESL